MFKLKFKEKIDPHKEELEAELTANEEYLRTMVAGTKEYAMVYDAVKQQREELRAYNKPKIGFKEVIEILTVVGTFGGIGAGVYSTIHKDQTREKLATYIYQNEELESKLGNGSIKTLATKE